MARYRYSGPLEIGSDSFQKGFEIKYGVIVKNVYEEMPITADSSPVSLVYEAGPRSFKNTSRGWPDSFELKDMVWLQDPSWGPNVLPLLVAAKSVGSLNSWYRTHLINSVINSYTIAHPIVVANNFMKQNNNKLIQSYNDFLQVRLWIEKGYGPIVSSKMLEMRNAQEQELALLVRTNNWNKEQIRQYKKEKANEVKQKAIETKNMNHAIKEFDMVTQLSLSLSSLIDEAKSLHAYMGDVENKMNTAHYKPRIAKVKQIIKILQKMRADS